MTLEELKKSPDLRGRIADLLKTPDMRVLLTAIKEDIISKLGYKPHIPGASAEFQMATWHCHVHGMQSVIKTMENIGNAPASGTDTPASQEYDHAVDPELRPDFKPPVPKSKK